MQIQSTFAPEGRSASEARRFVRGALRSWGAEDLADEAVLAVSELVTNAVVHAGTPVRVVLDLDAQGLRLEVEDRHPRRTLPLGLEDPPDESEHGRGLLIAATLATAWGVDYAAGAKRIWLRFDRGGGDLTDAVAAAAVTGSATGPDHRPVASAAGGPQPTEADVAVVELDPDGAVLSWNHDAVRLFGWSPDEVLGLPWSGLAEPLDTAHATGAGSAVPSWTEPRWQGRCAVRTKDGPSVEVFASRVSGPPGEGAVVLLVPARRRALLEWPEPRARSGAGTDAASHDPLGLREDALDRLGTQAYLDLAVERARDQLGGRAGYLLLVRDLDADYEVSAVSGLDGGLRGSHLEAGTAGTPHVRNPHLPTTLTDLADGDVPWLAGEEVRSLLVVPVVAEARVIGALGITSDRSVGFDDEQAVLLQRIGSAVAAAADRARLRTSERERRGWVSFLAESGDLLAGSLDPDMTMAITGQIVVPRLATWCAVYLDDARGEPVLQQVWHRDERAVPALRTALEHSRPGTVGKVEDDRIGGPVLDIPLIARGRRIGVLVLGRHGRGPLYGEALVVAESIVRRAALAIDNARVHGELQAIGEALQRGLLPASIPTSPTFDFGVVYEAAGERTLAGGDFYDLFPLGSGRWCFAVGDVCGTGAEAAAVTGLARHTLRSLVRTGFPVASALERLNTAILEEGERSRFLTLVCGTLEPVNGGGLRMGLVSAGHPLPFVVRRSGRVEQVGRPQSLLGVVERVTFVADEYVLERGDLLVAVTDGVLERRANGRMLGDEGLAADLASVGGLPAKAVAERIRRLVADFAPGPASDDMAVLALRVTS